MFIQGNPLLLLTTPNHFRLSSECIKMYQNTDYSHACLAYKVRGIGMTEVFESSYGDVHRLEYGLWKSRNIILEAYEIPIFEPRRKDLCEFIMLNQDKTYGYMSVLGMILNDIFKENKLGNDNGKTFTCAELMYNALICDSCADIDPDYIMVNELAEIARKRYTKISIETVGRKLGYDIPSN